MFADGSKDEDNDNAAGLSGLTIAVIALAVLSFCLLLALMVVWKSRHGSGRKRETPGMINELYGNPKSRVSVTNPTYSSTYLPGSPLGALTRDGAIQNANYQAHSAPNYVGQMAVPLVQDTSMIANWQGCMDPTYALFRDIYEPGRHPQAYEAMWSEARRTHNLGAGSQYIPVAESPGWLDATAGTCSAQSSNAASGYQDVAHGGVDEPAYDGFGTVAPGEAFAGYAELGGSGSYNPGDRSSRTQDPLAGENDQSLAGPNVEGAYDQPLAGPEVEGMYSVAHDANPHDGLNNVGYLQVEGATFGAGIAI